MKKIWLLLASACLSLASLNVSCGSQDAAPSDLSERFCEDAADCPKLPPKPKGNLKVRVVSKDCTTKKAILEVYNSGNASVAASIARVNYNHSSLAKNVQIPALAPGAKKSIPADIIFVPGTGHAALKADISNIIPESFETDNASIFSLCIG